jgi:polysaccharide export outer membrane protein
MPDISQTTEGKAKVQRIKVHAHLCALLFLSVVSLAQVRETGRVQVQAVQPPPPAGQTGNVPPVSESSLGRDSFSTSITGTRATLGPGDLLEITVFDTPELAQRTRINGEGKITMPLIGEIAASGLLPNELELTIRRKLIEGQFVRDPQVSVFVTEYAGQTAFITGEVNKPGGYSLLRSHRLRDIISLAGGLSSRAGNTVTIAREGEPQPLSIDLSGRDENQSNPEIKPGDNITVAQSGIVYVLGDVERPGGFVIDRRSSLSVMQALALAEGIKSSASTSKARLIRTNQEQREEIPLDLKKILKSQRPDILLQAGDIIFVPGSLLRGMGRRSIETILATASGVAIYSRP